VRFNKKQITKALVAAERALKTQPRPAAAVAGALNPYMGCTQIEGATGELHEDLRSAIFSTLGDAYRHEGNMELAAKWYRRASQLSTGRHARVYAWIVCKHQLAEFYNEALKVLEDDQRRWATKPLLTRFSRWVRTWSNADTRLMARSEKQTLEFLRQHAVAQAA
jgi:hypothetical protein